MARSRLRLVLVALACAALSAGACGGEEAVQSNPAPGAGLDASIDGGVAGSGGAGAGSGGDAAWPDGGAAGSSPEAGGAAGADATPERDGGDGEGGSAGDADASETDGGATGCVDIRIMHSSLPAQQGPWSSGGPPIGIFADRDHLWRDTQGVHVAWNAVRLNDPYAVLVVSSFDPKTGTLLGHRFFPDGGAKGMVAAGVAHDETVALEIGVANGDAASFYDALLVFRTDDPSNEHVYPLPPWPASQVILVGVGWDGEAFAVHASGNDNKEYVTRVKPDGTVLLPPKAFGLSVDYADRERYVTDPVEGSSYAVGGVGANFPWLTGHQRDGTPSPDPGKVQAVKLQPKGWQSGWAAGVTRATARAVPGGAAVAWSHDASPTIVMTTFIQAIGPGLAPTQDVIPIPGEPFPPPWPQSSLHDWLEWPTLQPVAAGWWIGGTNTLSMSEYQVINGALAGRRELVTYSKFGTKFDVRHLESANWNDELWLGFQDNTDTSGKEHPYRVILAKPGCTYRSMYEEALGP